MFLSFLLASSALFLCAGQKNHESCDYWAEHGECEKNPNYMLRDCKTSCDEIAAASVQAAGENSVDTSMPASFYDIKENDITGKLVDFSQFRGKVVYIVNVASYCGYTESNYNLISELSKYSKDGLEIVIFPCNQFGAQEPGTNSEISAFARSKGFRGLIMSKGDVNGAKTRSTFKFLKDATQKSYVTWNFDGKFIVDRSGKAHYLDDDNVVAQVQQYLNQKDL